MLLRIALFALACVPAMALAQLSCRYQGERVDGLKKTCFYKCADGEKSITIRSTESCPRTSP